MARNPVLRYLRSPDAIRPKSRLRRGSKLDPYTAHIDRRMGEGLENCVVLLRELRELGYDGSYTILSEYVSPRRRRRQPAATMRFETGPGEQAQVDWGSLPYINEDGKQRRVWVFVMRRSRPLPIIEGRRTAMKVLVCGGRDYSDMTTLRRTLDRLHAEHGFTTLIHGAARGADSLAGQWARHTGISVQEFPARWREHDRNCGYSCRRNSYCRRAGFRRNEAMLHHGRPDLVVAFPGGSGTQGMVDLARGASVETIVISKP